MFRLEKVEDQIAAGYEVIKKYHKTVTVFGSARTQKTTNITKRPAGNSVLFRPLKAMRLLLAAVAALWKWPTEEPKKKLAAHRLALILYCPHEQSLNDYTTDSFAFSILCTAQNCHDNDG